MMTSAQLVETSVNVITNILSQDYTHQDDHNIIHRLLMLPLGSNHLQRNKLNAFLSCILEYLTGEDGFAIGTNICTSKTTPT